MLELANRCLPLAPYLQDLRLQLYGSSTTPYHEGVKILDNFIEQVESHPSLLSLRIEHTEHNQTGEFRFRELGHHRMDFVLVRNRIASCARMSPSLLPHMLNYYGHEVFRRLL